MGQVYLSDDLVLGQSVALKFLPKHLAEREGGVLQRAKGQVAARRALLDEAKCWGRLGESAECWV